MNIEPAQELVYWIKEHVRFRYFNEFNEYGTIARRGLGEVARIIA